MYVVKFEQDLVRALLRDQHPDLAELELRDVKGGWMAEEFPFVEQDRPWDRASLIAAGNDVVPPEQAPGVQIAVPR
jgi:hypothetical protein